MIIATYNIHGCIGMDGRTDAARIAAVIRRAAPDFICLNEVDIHCVRTGDMDTLSELEGLTGLHGHFTLTLELKAPDFPEQGDTPGLYGNAMLTPHPFRMLKEISLPGTPAMEPRRCTFAEIRHPEQPFLAIFTHFCHRPEEEDFRVASVRLIHRECQALATGLPAVFCGDLNAEPDAPSITLLREDWLLHGEATGDYPASWPADNPVDRIDYLGLSSPHGTPAFNRVTILNETMASDHRPLVAEVSLS